MPKVFTSKSQKTGEIGEHIAVRYLKSKGYSIIERNYTKKWGEIDIVAKSRGVIHFVEVKSKIVPSLVPKALDDYRAEDGMHRWKVERLKRTVQTFLIENKITEDWSFDLITVYMSTDMKEAKVAFMENLIL